ncbi:glycoside hydrolase family 17 protein [Flavicella sediminum]|uniref:glycoside hydrolase family 17 protein n=1 Tax=Flavicella sediminum TaxID=2585141 RepID=UPI00111F9F76|nr:glycosyl hydrolase family 17 protein [Flavicella sediminum]
MSLRKENMLSLTGAHYNDKSTEELQEKFATVLKAGMHGLCFSPYEEGQEPGDLISEAQIRRRMEIIQPYTKWIRSFSCTDGNEMIPRVAHEFGIKTMVGAWLGDDAEVNKKEIANLIKVAKEGYVDLAAVGNEVLYRGDLEEEELLGFINEVKSAIPEVPVGYVDAYYEFVDYPRITNACDVVFANCYPYWEGCSLEYSLIYMKEMYAKAVKAANGKKVIVSETGWTNKGETLGGAIPSYENAIKYFLNAQKWSVEEDIEMFYFSSFDESWKTGAEGDVGACWGLWDKDENLKF